MSSRDRSPPKTSLAIGTRPREPDNPLHCKKKLGKLKILRQTASADFWVFSTSCFKFIQQKVEKFPKKISWENSKICFSWLTWNFKVAQLFFLQCAQSDPCCSLQLNHAMLVSSGQRRTVPPWLCLVAPKVFYSVSVTDGVLGPCLCPLWLAYLGTLCWLHRHYWKRAELDDVITESPMNWL